MLSSKEYFLKLLAWFFPASLLAWGLFRLVIPQYAFPSYFVIPVVMAVLGSLFYFLLRKIQHISIKKSFTWFMLNTVFKMMVSIVCIVVVARTSKESILPFAFTYLVFYLLLLVFETSWFLKVSRTTN